jgi:MFS family permease
LNPKSPDVKVAFAALRHPGFRAYFFTSALAMMADSVEHVISYWIIFQKFHSPPLGGIAVLTHWLPFLLFSGYSGALADRFDPRRIIQLGMVLFMAVSAAWGLLFVSRRAATTLSRISADDSPTRPLAISWNLTAGTSTCRSIRSSSGPEIRPR